MNGATITSSTTADALRAAGLDFNYNHTGGGNFAFEVIAAGGLKPDVLIGPFDRDGDPFDAAPLPGVSNDWASCVYVSPDDGEDDFERTIIAHTPEAAVAAVRTFL